MLMQNSDLSESRVSRTQALVVFFFVIFFILPVGRALSSPKPRAEAAGLKPTVAKGGKLVEFAELGLPHYTPPEAYKEDLVVQSDKGTMTMHRSVDHGNIRTEISSQGQQMILIETGDEKGTFYMLMPDQKKAMKQSRQGSMEAASKTKMPKQAEPDAKASPPETKVEDLGEETIEGTAARKVRFPGGGGNVVGWFDKGTGAPIRMETQADGEKSSLDWKNRKVEPQPAELFQVPKGYEVTDMDEMMKKMGSMGGMGAMGGIGGMAKGMAGGMVQGMGSNLGGSLGSMVGGSLGGPLGAAAGQFIGGKIGGVLSKKAVNAIH